MKTWHIAIALGGLLCALLFPACGPESATSKPLSGPPLTGALYSLSDNEGGFRAGKVLAAEDAVVFVLLYGERWTKRPTLPQAKQAGGAVTNAFPLAFSSQSFADMQPVHLENGTVTPEDLEAYEDWKKSKREIF